MHITHCLSSFERPKLATTHYVAVLILVGTVRTANSDSTDGSILHIHVEQEFRVGCGGPTKGCLARKGYSKAAGSVS